LSPTPKSVKLAIYGWTLDSHSGVGRCPILGRWIPAFAGMSAAFSSFVVPCPGMKVIGTTNNFFEDSDALSLLVTVP